MAKRLGSRAVERMVIVAAIAITLGACRAPARAPLSELTVLYTADTRGHIEPCGCSSGQAGGISRRMTYLRENRKELALLVDAGDVTAGARDWEFFELQYLLKGYAAMDYDGVNAGHREATIDAARLRQLAAEYPFLVSANLVDESGKTVFPPYRMVELGGGRRAGIIGVMDETIDPAELGKGLKVLPAAETIAAHLPALAKKSDALVALVFGDEELMRGLAERFYEIDVIVGGKVLQPTHTPIKANRSLLVAMTDKGKAIGRLELRFDANGAVAESNEIHMLPDTFPEDAELAGIVKEFKSKLEEMEFKPHRDDEEGLTAITAARSPSADRYVAAQDCAKCHPQAVKLWESSKHAHSYDSLVGRWHEFNPRCLQCHTVGYGASDGFVSKRETPTLAAVSCGSCHGRGDYHVKRHSGQSLPGRPAPLRSLDCVTCHDPENSPKFDRNAYWELIKHGRE